MLPGFGVGNKSAPGYWGGRGAALLCHLKDADGLCLLFASTTHSALQRRGWPAPLRENPLLGTVGKTNKGRSVSRGRPLKHCMTRDKGHVLSPQTFPARP